MAEEKVKGIIKANSSCIACGACASICRAGAISIVGGVAQIDKSKCVKCGDCGNFCPMQAINHNEE